MKAIEERQIARFAGPSSIVIIPKYRERGTLFLLVKLLREFLLKNYDMGSISVGVELKNCSRV